MQVALFGGLILLLFLLTGKSSRQDEPHEEEKRPPTPPPPPLRPASVTPTAPLAPSAAPSRPPSPSPGAVSPPRGSGAPVLSPAQVEEIRQVIAVGFQKAMQKRRDRVKAAGKTEPEQQTINVTASFFRAQGIPLDKPDPQNLPALYKTGIKAVADKVANTINLFMPEPKPKAAPAPIVTTTPAPDKVKTVREGYAKAIAYAIDAAKQRAGRALTPENVLVPVSQHFAAFGIPHPNELTAAHKFWANPLSTITKQVADAVRYSHQQVDIQIPPSRGQA